MKIELRKSQSGATTETLIVPTTQTKKGKDSIAHISHAAIGKKYSTLIENKNVTGAEKETVFLREQNTEWGRNLLFVGTGVTLDAEKARQLGAAIYKCLSSEKVFAASIDLTHLRGGKESVGALAEGLILASYKFDELKSAGKDKDHDKKDGKKDEKELVIYFETKGAPDATTKKAVDQALILAETVNFSRRLGDMPGNLMTPSILAQHAIDAAKGTKLKVTAWDRNKIVKEKMGGLAGVARGSNEEPRFIIMEYKGAAASKKPVVFVGKGLTFDSGGISLKPGAGMEEMKYDMCGGANVIGTMLAIAKLKLKINAYGLIPATENMPSGTATKPGDVHTARNGKTFEINNTDAEGRLILSDALCYGSELKPQLMVDAATLTGAIVVALGNTHTGYFTRDQKLKAKIEKAANSSGEWVWNMPLCDFHKDDMKGTFADLSNMSSGKGAGSATAAAFLEQFVDEEIPWAHFDIAGTAWAVGGRLNYCSPKGASGVMVRTFVELAKQYE